MKKCPVCGKAFRSRKALHQRFCSTECAKIGQKGRKIMSEAFLEACKHRGVPGPRKHPRTGKFETNCHAKVWHLESPEGEEITARNLKLYMINRYGEKEGKRVYGLLVCAAGRFRKMGRGNGAGWNALAVFSPVPTPINTKTAVTWKNGPLPAMMQKETRLKSSCFLNK